MTRKWIRKQSAAMFAMRHDRGQRDRGHAPPARLVDVPVRRRRPRAGSGGQARAAGTSIRKTVVACEPEMISLGSET